MTSTPDPREFVKTLYTPPERHERILLAGLSAGQKNPRQWYWDGKNFPDHPSLYVCVCTVRANGEYPRRRKADCLAAYVVMLDDVGTKADTPPVDPTAVLETSPGNYQYIYALERFPVDTPEALARYEGAVHALIDAGYSDPGAGGATRVYRLPGSRNTKRGLRGFATRVVSWQPDRRWPLDGLMEAFAIKPPQPAAAPARATSPGLMEAFAIKPPQPAAAPARATSPPAETVADPVAGWLFERGLAQGATDAWISVRCPWAAAHSDGDGEAGYSPLGQGEHPLYRGFHCFHAHCVSRGAQDFLAWVAEQGGPKVGVLGVKDVSLAELKQYLTDTPEDPHDLVWAMLPELFATNLPDVVRGQKGQPRVGQLATVPNVRAVAGTYGIELRYNLHKRRAEARFTGENFRALYDATFTWQCLIDGCQRVGIPASSRLNEILNRLAEGAKYHPFAEWLAGVTWDGTDRLEPLAASVSVTDTFRELWPVYLRRWLIQAVQAACGWQNPRQIGNVLVLAGAQGVRKTTWLARLFPEGYFSDGVHLGLGGFGHKDAVMVATANLAMELGELEVTFQRSVQGALKAFLTSAEDSYRPPYGTHVADFPRTSVYCATVNRLDFLMDQTGSRRYWPVMVRRCDPEHGVDLAQLWAQVHALWKSGEPWWLDETDQQLGDALSGEFAVIDPAVELLDAYLDGYDHSIKRRDIWKPCNITTIAKLLDLDANKRQTLSSLRYRLEERLGPRKRQIDGVRSCWLFPSGGGYPLPAYEPQWENQNGQQDDEEPPF